MSNDEFYVGYEPKAPASLSRWVRATVLMLLLVAAVMAFLIVPAQRPFDRSDFEFGVVREFSGIVQEKPYPVLWVPRPGQTSPEQAYSGYPLVAFGKLGASAEVAGLNGQAATVKGTLIYRDGQALIQTEADSWVRSGDEAKAGWPALQPPSADLGEMKLIGEIIDAKCFFGVMKPGNLKPHRDCATRCISGGLPPMLLVRGEGGVAKYFLLVDRDGQTLNQRILDRIAEPVEVSGHVWRHGELNVIHANPSDIVRVGV